MSQSECKRTLVNVRFERNSRFFILTETLEIIYRLLQHSSKVCWCMALYCSMLIWDGSISYERPEFVMAFTNFETGILQCPGLVPDPDPPVQNLVLKILLSYSYDLIICNVHLYDLYIIYSIILYANMSFSVRTVCSSCPWEKHSLHWT